ncbi:beta-glycosidase [Adhaeribacter arboris]|uniref:Beta-glycosidase n=1 Tax=Adhaeribacter arboris TaxID=2072846 RepID=A0A2T2YA98_9BACT|nr:glycoside hydrolase [Adhaeribacter arboris]PSR52423.1 beta-glycosidase [Adhaeribacter arboris]
MNLSARKFNLAIFLLVICSEISLAQQSNLKPLIITIDTKKQAQTIDNFGAAGCWYAEGIGKFWPTQKKERIAELLFSQERDEKGNPKGIGLSAWRFNIGGGTTEQGDNSGIKEVNRRVESFLNSDGTYDWSKQAGYTWFLKKAKNYGVEKLIAFSNTPPVQMTKNNLGYKTEKDYRSNLKPDQYEAYTNFLTEVLQHYEKEGLRFNYISPVNEPQWDWTGKFGEAKQEGSPWRNDEIAQVVKSLDNALEKKKLTSQIILPEAAKLTFLYRDTTHSSRQVQQFFGKNSSLNLSTLKHLPKLVVGHSYFTDEGDSATVAIRAQLADTVSKYGVQFWQSEYSMLADGFREGMKGRRSGMDCGLFLAKIIHQDVTVANAAAWQFWNAFEPGKPDFDTRYYLIALQPNANYTDGEFYATKNLWALGHYSLFIRPGMHRLVITRNDNLSPVAAAQKVMVSSFADATGKLVVVAINYEMEARNLQLNVKNYSSGAVYKRYVTTAAAADNLKPYPAGKISQAITLPPRSITTLVIQK